MTIKEYLALPQQEQARIAGKLRKGPWKHKNGGFGMCEKCSSSLFFQVVAEGDCEVPTPIPIDWNHARALQGEIGNLIFFKYLREVYLALGGSTFEIDFFRWAAGTAIDAAHIFAALLKAKGELT